MAKHKKSMNPIPPVLRGKKRYVKFALLCDFPLAEKDVWHALRFAISSLFGDFGFAGIKFWPIKWDFGKNEGIFRCSLEGLEGARLSVLFVQSVGGKKAIPVIVSVSGSVSKLKS